MAAPLPSLVFDRCLGAIETVSPWAIPSGYAASAVNVDLSPYGLMRPRSGTTTLDAGANADIHNLFTEQINGVEALWSFSSWVSGTPAAHRYTTSGGEATITLTDTPAYSGSNASQQVVCVAYNGKVFLAYNSAVNRLHVYDSTAVSPAVRRVGIGAVAAATVANTGAGAYAATIRYYKIQMRRHLNADATQARLASSELSPSVSFTPSGAGAAARITKPATVDSCTHWAVYASVDDVTYYDITGSLAVASTTYDDSFSPSNYAIPTGNVQPEVGLFVPPPSCKLLATNGERIFMAGAYETTASAGETTPANRRVWFTRPLGATDEGDDESITSTGASRYWIDIDNEDGSPITGLLSALDGTIYVGTATSLWRLTDTGQTDVPVRAERVVAGVGPVTHYAMTSTDTVDGATIYFGAPDGPYRYSPAFGVQYLGSDWVIPNAATHSVSAGRFQCCQFDPATRRIYWLFSDGASPSAFSARVFDPSLSRNIEGVMRGGWSLDTYAYGRRLFCLSVFEGRLYVGGVAASAVGMLFCKSNAVSTDGGGAYTSTLVTPEVVIGDGSVNFRTEEPYVWKRRNQAASLVFTRNRGGTGNTVSESAPSETINVGETGWHRQKIEGGVLADVYSMSVELQITTPIITAETRHTDGIDRLVVPYLPQERG